MSLESELFEAYRQDRIDHEIAGFQLERLPHLRRHLPLAGSAGGEALICFSQLDAGQEEQQIEAQLAHFRTLSQDFEWKVYALERPAHLRQLLEEKGFVADEPECFMLYPLNDELTRQSKPESASGSGLPADLEVRRIVDPSQLDDVLAVQAAIWGRDFEWLRDKLARSLQQADTMSMFCAYVQGQAIGTGWTDYPPGSRFPELHGGGVLPAWRQRGVYSALFECRFKEARERGFEWMAVDASPMSRPILQAMGFMPVCMTWPMRYAFAATEGRRA
ncbi:GNAT family N-acetyltransferase [Paucibacter sp. AS339]|uniref:GNAT family N-acetyltransferase n=1 Tax=Paucibacter hankyongi TaxID=3133434 RepID=UPI0030B08FD6